MKITIEQTLHGYLDGHQLLNSSIELSIEEKRILLYQTDLSGSSVEESFKTYITGYPIIKRNLYAFSYSWYADEMKRPGCVWTQTLLIAFSDLGKIPEFTFLLSLFKRPKLGEYQDYGQSILLDEEVLISTFDTGNQNNDERKKVLLEALYEHPENTIIIPSNSSKEYENLILDLWSDQWPRLRRRFTFCSGALNVRSLDKKPFDLQVIPYSRTNLIQRQSDDLLIVKDGFTLKRFDWDMLMKFSKTKVRQFLWVNGSDIFGERKNLIPLLEIFLLLNDPTTSVLSLSHTVSKYFPLKNEAISLKNRLYGNEAILPPHLSEKEIINYIVTSEDVDFIPNEKINITDRLIDLINSNEISLTDFVNVWNSARPERINKDIWKSLNISEDELSNLVTGNENLLDVMIDNYPKVLCSEKIWKTDYTLQKSIIEKLQARTQNLDREIVFAALDAGSSIIGDMYNLAGSKVIWDSLDWLNDGETKLRFPGDWATFITKKEKNTFREWVSLNQNNLNGKIYEMIFLNLHYDDIRQFYFESSIWIKGYQVLQASNSRVNIVYVAAVLLSLALNNKLVKSENIIVEAFHDFYSYAASSKIESSVWNIIPSYDEDFDESEDSLNFFARLFGFNSVKKKRAESWDYCERLIRILVDKYVKYEWSSQSFLNTLKNKIAFERTLKYCLNSKKGFVLLERLAIDFKKGKVKPLPFQTVFMNPILGQENI
jgi:hypothetical protein